MELKGLKINFLGDSITEGYDSSDLEHCYWGLLAKNDGVIARGYGIAGTRIARQQSMFIDPKWDDYFRTRVDKMDPDADVVVVFGGVNDHGHGDAHLGKMSDRTDDTFYGALHLLYQDIIKRYPGAKLVVMTPMRYEDEDALVNGFGIRKDGPLSAYRDAICEVAEDYDIYLLDIYNKCGIDPRDPKLRREFTSDGLHPNDAGHAVLYRLLREFLMGL